MSYDCNNLFYFVFQYNTMFHFNKSCFVFFAYRCFSITNSPSYSFSVTVERSKLQAVREAATICSRPLQVDLWPFDLESSVRVTCSVQFSSPSLTWCWVLSTSVQDHDTVICVIDTVVAGTEMSSGVAGMRTEMVQMWHWAVARSTLNARSPSEDRRVAGTGTVYKVIQ